MEDSKQIIDAMMAAKTIDYKRNPDLLPDCGVPFPYDQIVAHKARKFKHGKTAVEENQLVDSDEEPEDFDAAAGQLAAFQESWSDVANSNDVVASSLVAQAQGRAPLQVGAKHEDATEGDKHAERDRQERDKVAIAGIRKVHSAFDTATREWGATLSQS